MRKRKKTFDCVAMKRSGAERVRNQIKDMTIEEQIEFWRAGTAQLLDVQRKLKTRRAKKSPGLGRNKEANDSQEVRK